MPTATPRCTKPGHADVAELLAQAFPAAWKLADNLGRLPSLSSLDSAAAAAQAAEANAGD
eukprot:SM000281S10742  [mRNA]  locus=s281:87544:88124:+ [translate_table: standard]